MLQINNLTLTHKKDLRVILQDFSLTLNDGDKAVVIGEEGNGKSTLIKWIYNPELVEDYIEWEGGKVDRGEKIAYLPQELPEEEKQRTVYEFFSHDGLLFDFSPKELAEFAGKIKKSAEFFYSDQLMGTLSGGEKVKTQIIRLLMSKPTVLLLDEPSNDIDMETLKWLETLLNEWEYKVLFISHDETLIENTANMVIHLEQLKRKTESRYTVAKMPYQQYVAERLHRIEKQEQQAKSDRREKQIRDEKFQRVYQSVEHAQATITRQDPATGRLLKKKMHAVKSMQHRFEREDENMTRMPEQEEAIFFKLGDKDSAVPAGKTVVEFTLEKLRSPDRLLAQDVFLRVRGPGKVCIIGENGCGKTTLFKYLVQELGSREDLKVEYMPQNYEDCLNLEQSAVEFLDSTGDKEIRTRIRTYLGALKYTPEEMEHPMRELSGGQKAKVFLLKMSLSKADVLLLDEPTRNFSPLSGPVIRKMLKEFPGAILSISHDRKYIREVCDTVYRLETSGLHQISKEELM